MQALREHAIMDTLPEPVFDEIVRRAAAVCETPIALLTLVDERRQWFKARTGFALPELPRGMGFDAIAIQQEAPLVIPDATEDARFSCDPLVLSELNIRFYAGVQITTEEGYPIGVLSVMDYAGRRFTAAQLRALGEQAQQAMLQLNLRRKLIASTTAAAEPASMTMVTTVQEPGAERRAILPDVMMRFGRDFRYSYVSPFAIETIGLRPDTLLGREVGAERVPVPFAEPLKEALQRAVQNRRIEEIEFLYMSPSGQRLFQTRLMPEISGGEVQAILSITREVVPDERAAPEPIPVRPALRALLGMAIAESTTLPELLQRCAEALSEFSGAPLVRIWVRDAKNNALMLRANAGDAANLISGDPGSTVIDIPADANTLDALAEYAFRSEAVESEARELFATDALPLKAGSLLLGIVALRDRQAPPADVRDEMLESSGTIASALRRGQEADALTEHATNLAKDLLDAKLALQREAETAANLAVEVRREAEAAASIAAQLQREADRSAGLTEQLQREAEHSASLKQELERQAESSENLKEELQREAAQAANLKVELERQAEHAAHMAEAAHRQAEEAANAADDRRNDGVDAATVADDRRREVENAASLAHELRTPLSSVLGLTNLLLNTELDPAQRELGEMTRSSARALLQLVNETFDGPAAEGDRDHAEGPREVTLEAMPFDLRQVVEDVGTMLAAKAQGKGIDLIVRCAPTMPDGVIGDAGRIRQILTNLVDNAIKFTREGFVLVDAASEDPESGEASLSVEVEDTGIGISPEQMETIFDRYVQAGSIPDSAERGAGLGLSISRELAQKMGGTIAVKSQVDDGSIFRFTLRLPVDANAPAHSDPMGIKGMRALIVDGPRLQQFAAREMMNVWGVSVDICATVGEMLDAMQDALQDEYPYHVVLLDETMAGSDSRGVISAVLNTAAFQQGRLVILTSVARNRDVERMVAEGIATALTKPIRRNPLFESLSVIAGELGPRAYRPAEQAPIQEELEAPVSIEEDAPRHIPTDGGVAYRLVQPEEAEADDREPLDLAAPSVPSTERAEHEARFVDDRAEAPIPTEANEPLTSERREAITATEQPSSRMDLVEEPAALHTDAPHLELSGEAAAPRTLDHSGAGDAPSPNMNAVAAAFMAETTLSAEAVAPVADMESPITDLGSALEVEAPVIESAVENRSLLTEPAVPVTVVEAPVEAAAPAIETEAPLEVVVTASPEVRAEPSAIDKVLPTRNLIEEPGSAQGVTAMAASDILHDTDHPFGQQALQPEDTHDKTFALVVEDDAVNQHVAKMMLEKMGCLVDVASSGSEAIALFETRVYDLVLIDCKMTGMDGYETTAALRRMESGDRHTPIVAVTADTAAGVRERCLRAGMDAYIAKPVHEEDLKYEIEKLLNSSLPAREVPEQAPLDEILNRGALMARVAGNTDVLRSLANLCRAECSRLMEEIRDSISTGDRSQFLRATHKLRGNIMSMEARAAVEAVRQLELTANQGRPADAEEMLDPLQNELERLLAAMNAILDDAEVAA